MDSNTPATVDIVDVFPESRKLPAGMITAGAYLFDAHGGKHLVKDVTGLKRGPVKVRRDDGWADEWDENELVTFIPSPANFPKVGDGATEHLYTDKLPYVVVAVSKSETTVTLRPLREVSEVKGTHNGFPVIDHAYTEDELTTMLYDDDRTIKARRRKDGRYYSSRERFTFDGARYRRDYSD